MSRSVVVAVYGRDDTKTVVLGSEGSRLFAYFCLTFPVDGSPSLSDIKSSEAMSRCVMVCRLTLFQN